MVSTSDNSEPGSETCNLILTFTDVITFRDQRDVQIELKAYRRNAEEITKKLIAQLRKDFRVNADRALKLKLVRDDDSVETFYSTTPSVSLVAAPRATPASYRGYYRYVCVYTMA